MPSEMNQLSSAAAAQSHHPHQRPGTPRNAAAVRCLDRGTRCVVLGCTPARSGLAARGEDKNASAASARVTAPPRIAVTSSDGGLRLPSLWALAAMLFAENDLGRLPPCHAALIDRHPPAALRLIRAS
jgi:hypothetical protein